LGAGIRAANLLYPDAAGYIATQATSLTAGVDPIALFYGSQIADKWVASRQGDGSSLPQTDELFNPEPGHHRHDPVSRQPNLGRAWGQVNPFVLDDVATDAKLNPPPGITTAEYAKAFDDVFVSVR